MKRDSGSDSHYYKNFIDESDTAMALLNRQGLFLTYNKKFMGLLESLSRGRTFPESIDDILNTGQEIIFWSSIEPVIMGQKKNVVFECPFQIQMKGEEIPRWFSIHVWEIVPPDSSAGADPLLGLYVEDNTLVKEEEMKLLHEKEIAEKAEEAESQFLARMSHEIRTPIQTIIGMTELLQDTALDHEQAEYSRQVQFAADVLLSLVNDILDYSKMEAGKMELEHIEFDLEQVVVEAAEMIALEAHKKGLFIATDIPMETSIIMTGDPGKFRQVIINLVKNAVKFTGEGGVLISLEMASLEMASLAESAAVRVSVADTGIGVNEETRTRLFSSFMQADVSDTRRFGGTGLGLAICKTFVELMKGRIEMVPNEGGGSIFRFDIPLEEYRRKPPPLPPDGRVRILIVDDRIQESKIILSYLNDLGYKDIDQADSGEAALALMRKASAEARPFSLCFIDMIMPVMDGWRLAAEIQNDSGIDPADLILMVPHGLMGKDTKMTLLKWFKAYINKPVKRLDLGETITAVMNEIREVEESPAFLESAEEPGDAANTAIGEKNLPVLIAEDHPVNQKLFSMIMEKLKIPCIVADDGQDALEKAHLNEVALIFMDIQMPRMNGYEAAVNLRSQGFRKPIIALTAGVLPEEREQCLKSGIDDVLLKPFKLSDIEAVLDKWLKPAKDRVFSGPGMLETFMNNKEIALPLLKRFIERTQAQLEGLPALEEAGDWDTALREAHTIKGAALTMSGTDLGKAAARLELAYKSKNHDEMKTAFPAMVKAFYRFRDEAEAFARSIGTG